MPCKMVIDLRFFKPKTVLSVGHSGDLTLSTPKLAIAIARFWCVKSIVARGGTRGADPAQGSRGLEGP